jgi:hypothetical protein
MPCCALPLQALLQHVLLLLMVVVVVVVVTEVVNQCLYERVIKRRHKNTKSSNAHKLPLSPSGVGAVGRYHHHRHQHIHGYNHVPLVAE